MITAKNIEKAFNLAPIEESNVIEGEVVPYAGEEVTELTPVPNTAPTKLEDSDFVKKELRDLVELTKEALDTAVMVQQEDPSSRNAEAVAKMADTVVKVLNSITQLNKMDSDEKNRKKTSEASVTNVTNNTIITTTSDLITSIVREARKKIDAQR